MRISVVSYDSDAPKEQQRGSLLMGLDDVVAELIQDHAMPPGDVMARCEDAIDIAQEEQE